MFTDSVSGLSRPTNKDCAFVVRGKDYVLACLMDGVSTASGSHRAVARAREYVGKSHAIYLEPSQPRMLELVEGINDEMVRSGKEPYSTFVGLLVKGEGHGEVTVVSIGDSRAYGISNQAFDQLTTDDNEIHRKNVLTRYLGDPGLVLSSSDLDTVSANYNAVFLCTDGLYTSFESDLKTKLSLHKVITKFSKSKIRIGIRSRCLRNNSDDASYALLRWTNVCN